MRYMCEAGHEVTTTNWCKTVPVECPAWVEGKPCKLPLKRVRG